MVIFSNNNIMGRTSGRIMEDLKQSNNFFFGGGGGISKDRWTQTKCLRSMFSASEINQRGSRQLDTDVNLEMKLTPSESVPGDRPSWLCFF